MLGEYGLEENLETVRKWYDGYRFGETEVYNPWSVINYVDSCYKGQARVREALLVQHQLQQHCEKSGGARGSFREAGDRAADRGRDH